VHFHRFNCFQMRRQRYELILEHPNFQRRKMISRTDPVIRAASSLSTSSVSILPVSLIRTATASVGSSATRTPSRSLTTTCNQSRVRWNQQNKNCSDQPLHPLFQYVRSLRKVSGRFFLSCYTYRCYTLLLFLSAYSLFLFLLP